jgi:predicted PurR-regulated permease PerM
MESIITPLIVAFLIAFAIIWLNNFFRKKFKFTFLLSSITSLLVYAFLIFLIWNLVWSNIEELNNNIWTYQEKFQELIINSKDFLPFNLDFDLQKYAWKINFEKLSKNIASWLANLFSNIWLIFFYVIFMLLEYKYFWYKLSWIFENKEKREDVLNTIEQIRTEVSNYFYMKAIISFFTAFFSYLVLIIFWLDFAIFWAVFIFILNFVPNIWSIIAVFFPILLALFQFWFNTSFILLTSFLVWIQVFMWNVVEPKYMWNKLNLSPLVILISLVFWGNLWWVAWMFLSVPIMIILNIIFSKIEKTRWLAILLSEKWEIKEDFLEKTTKKSKKFFLNLKNKIKK